MIKVIENNNMKINYKNTLKGAIIAVSITIILLFVYSILLTYTRISENTIPTVIIVITAISIIIGSQLSTMKIKKNGIVNGALIGVIYVLTLYIISSIMSKNFTLSIYSIIMCLIGIISGMIGGIIGVNIK